MQTEFRRAAMRLGQGAKTTLNAVLGRLTVQVLKAVRRTDPNRAADFGARFMRRVGPLFREHRIGRANIAAAFPEWSPQQVEQTLASVWDNLGRVGAEFAHLDRLWDFDPATQALAGIEFTPGTSARFIKLRDDGKPALFFAAHLANWELPALVASMHGLDTSIMFRRPNMPEVDRLVREVRSSRMGTLIPTGLDAPTRIAEALERGSHVGMLVDQYYVRGVDVTFFGRTTKANPLIARLARRIDCPIHGARAIRLPNHRFRVDLTDAIEPARDATGEVDVAATMQRITSVIEGWIREQPGQWLWLHRRWR